MKKIAIVSVLFAALALACSSETESKPETTPEGPVGDSPAAEAAQEYHAICGCSLEGIGECGNYIEIGESFVVLEHESLGVMEFCRDKEAGAQIKVAGSMQEGKFVATSYERLD
jgi:hypothetical protein